MKLIALIGDKNTGKSQSINIVYTYLLISGYIQVPTHYRRLGDYQKSRDCIDILSNGKEKIGVIGMGDYGPKEGKVRDRLINLIEELIKHKCDVIVCSCTNRDDIVGSISQYGPEFVNKTISEDVLSLDDDLYGKDFGVINAMDAMKILLKVKLL